MSEFSFYYNLVDAIAYFIASTIPIYFILKLNKNKRDNKNKRLKDITIFLVAFVLIQGIYHIASIFGLNMWAKGVIEPLSIIALIFFGLIYLLEMIREKRLANQEKDKI